MPPQVYTSALISHIVVPQPGDLVCDPGAAPHSITSRLAQVMGTYGIIGVHEPVHTQLAMLEYPLKHLGMSNVVTTRYTGQTFPLWCKFTRVLDDAPCSVPGQVSLRHTGTYTACASCPWHDRRLAAFAKVFIDTGVCYPGPEGRFIYATCT